MRFVLPMLALLIAAASADEQECNALRVGRQCKAVEGCSWRRRKRAPKCVFEGVVGGVTEPPTVPPPQSCGDFKNRRQCVLGECDWRARSRKCFDVELDDGVTMPPTVPPPKSCRDFKHRRQCDPEECEWRVRSRKCFDKPIPTPTAAPVAAPVLNRPPRKAYAAAEDDAYAYPSGSPRRGNDVGVCSRPVMGCDSVDARECRSFKGCRSRGLACSDAPCRPSPIPCSRFPKKDKASCDYISCGAMQATLQATARASHECVSHGGKGPISHDFASCLGVLTRVIEEQFPDYEERCRETVMSSVPAFTQERHVPWKTNGAKGVFVDYSGGKDRARTKGSRRDPFKTIAYALEQTEGAERRVVYLLDGPHFVPDSVAIPSGVDVVPFSNEDPVVFGGLPALEFNSKWTPESPQGMIYYADLSEELSARLSDVEFPDLFLNGKRLARAASAPTPFNYDDLIWSNDDTPIADSISRAALRSETQEKFTDFVSAVGGWATRYSFSTNPHVGRRISLKDKSAYTDFPIGLKHDPFALRYPGVNGLMLRFTSSNGTADYAFLATPIEDDVLKIESTGGSSFSSKGFDAAGIGTWTLENAKDFLDVPGEYYLDKTHAPYRLYYHAHSTDDLSNGHFTFSTTPTVFVLQGDDISVRGLTIRNTLDYALERHASGNGPYTYHPSAAVVISAASTNAVVAGNSFSSLGSTGVFIRGGSTNARVIGNSFVSVLNSWAVVAAGSARSALRPWELTVWSSGTVIAHNNVNLDPSRRGIFLALTAAVSVVGNMFSGRGVGVGVDDGVRPLSDGHSIMQNVFFGCTLEARNNQPYFDPLANDVFDSVGDALDENVFYGGNGLLLVDGASLYTTTRNLFVGADRFFSGAIQTSNGDVSIDSTLTLGETNGRVCTDASTGHIIDCDLGLYHEFTVVDGVVVSKNGALVYSTSVPDMCPSPQEYVKSENNQFITNDFPDWGTFARCGDFVTPIIGWVSGFEQDILSEIRWLDDEVDAKQWSSILKSALRML